MWIRFKFFSILTKKLQSKTVSTLNIFRFEQIFFRSEISTFGLSLILNELQNLRTIQAICKLVAAPVAFYRFAYCYWLSLVTTCYN